jgi:beta-lactamase class A
MKLGPASQAIAMQQCYITWKLVTVSIRQGHVSQKELLAKGGVMIHSRREFLKTTAATATLATVPVAEVATVVPGQTITPQEIVALFGHLPGDKAFKIFAPATEDGPKFQAQLNSDRRLFVASAIKTFVLCEALRQIDSPDVVDKLAKTEMGLDSSVWSFGSPAFNPPDLKGTVFERAALEAMITSSDNTATDMMFKLAGADNVRKFITAAGLTQTLVPDSTRAFTAYLVGADNYKTISWDDLLKKVIPADPEGDPQKFVHPFLNDVQSLASSADDFVSYYSRALRGKFFQHRETLNEFRRILTLCDFIYLVPLPLGVSAYAKSGNADTEGFHARSIAGGLFFSNQWVFFAFIINWYAESVDDSRTVDQFFSAINRALTLIKNSVSDGCESA